MAQISVPPKSIQDLLRLVLDESASALQVAVVSGGASGTQHTEDAAAAADPVGNALALVRDDSLSGSLTSANGDIVAARGTNSGELYVADSTARTSLAAVRTSVELIDDAVSTIGSASPSKGVSVAGHDGTNARLIKTDTAGELQVDVLTLPNVTLAASTNNVGDVDVLTLPALPAGTNNIGDVDVLTQPARAATTDTITAKLATDAIQNGTTSLTPKFAAIDAATSGDNTLVAAVASKKIRVLSLFLVAAGAVNARLESGAGGTALTGQMNLAANGGFVLPFNPVGWFETASNTLLNLELSAAVSVDGSLTYVEV